MLFNQTQWKRHPSSIPSKSPNLRESKKWSKRDFGLLPSQKLNSTNIILNLTRLNNAKENITKTPHRRLKPTSHNLLFGRIEGFSRKNGSHEINLQKKKLVIVVMHSLDIYRPNSRGLLLSSWILIVMTILFILIFVFILICTP